MIDNTYRPRSRIGIFLRNQVHWAKYALPCFGAWLIYLMAFYPGIMSQDSLVQWRQVLKFDFNNWHPAFHTFLNWLITRIWLSPAAIALTQILAMSTLIGWGLSKFHRLGVPSTALWMVCGLFALSPVMGMMTITLWKDISYSISVLWLTLLLVEVIASDGKWLITSWRNAILLGIVLFLVAIFRHNGLPVALGTILVLGLVYRSFWKRVLAVFIITISIYGAVHEFLYKAINVKRMSIVAKHSTLIHQVAAVIAAGALLTQEEQDVLDRILPLKKWKTRYSCACVNPLIYKTPHINAQEFDKNVTSFRHIWLSLILRNPETVLKHQLCAGNLVWKVLPRHYLYTVERGIKEPNEFGLSTHSQLPRLRDFLKRLVTLTERPKRIKLIWRPALYLYGTLLLTTFAAFRMRKATWLMFASPVLLHSVVLLLINIAQDFRYQFPVYLVGLMSICLPFCKKE